MSELLNNNECERKLLKIDEIIEEKEEEHRNEIKKLNNKLHEKILENEKYQQEIYELQHSLKACQAVQRDLAEANELMEENFVTQRKETEKKINNLLEKFAVEKKSYEEKITEFQTNFINEEKKNEELRETINVKEKLLSKIKFEKDPDETLENSILKDKIKDLMRDSEERQCIERDYLIRQQELEETISSLRLNYNEIQNILQVKKEDLQSLNEILETTRDELVMCRSELQSLKSAPASESVRGNSLFAEVEDNRQKLINDISSLKKKYLQMKQTYGAKEIEIRTLKVEKAALLKKWDEDTVETVDHSAHLIETYKSRISELETKIKMQEKKQKMKGASNREQSAENNFSYLQSLLTAKKKEVEELYNKLEESSVQKILQEEMKYEVEKQLRQWKCKAMCYQAQLLASQNQTKCNECMKIGLKNAGDGDPQCHIETEKFDSRQPTTIPTLSDKFDTTLQKLLQIPEITKKKDDEIIEDCSGINLDEFVENISAIQIEGTIYMDETIPISSKILSEQKLVSEHEESNKENMATTTNDDDKTLKSALVKSADNVQEKIKKSLRFATDTVDHEKPKLVRQKIERKAYPVVFISNQSSK